MGYGPSHCISGLWVSFHFPDESADIVFRTPFPYGMDDGHAPIIVLYTDMAMFHLSLPWLKYHYYILNVDYRCYGISIHG
jgi:hypothetical protein